ncbi:MAG: heparan-alpha-glucosaminide N-acetyltransferase domain-containing protein [Terricaulis sp.]
MKATTHPASARANAAPTLTAGVRISELDLLRGLVIVLMALDHVRDYMLGGAGMVGVGSNLLDPTTTTPALYITRWITHLCAPTFVFLAGVSAYLQFAKGKTTPNLSRFLLTRGLWLIFLEATVISFGWSFGFPYVFFLQVIWAIGWSMLALGVLVWLPRMAVLAIGIAITLGHNLLDPINAQQMTGLAQLGWTFLHDGGPIFVGQQPIGLIAYPMLPWVGIICLGYSLGNVFTEAPEKRNRTILPMGLAMLAAFLVLRLTMIYGDPAFATGPEAVWRDWREQQTLGAAIMVFFDVQKYPPSLQFTLVTLGIIFTIWPLLSRLRGPMASVLNTFGAVPFFFYVLHIYLIHVLAIAVNAVAGNNVEGLFNYMINVFMAPEKLQSLGFALPWVYVTWLVVLALLYPLCRYWQSLKARRRDWWLSYL